MWSLPVVVAAAAAFVGSGLCHDDCSGSRSYRRPSTLQARDEFSDFFNITQFPNEQKQNVTKYLREAEDLAGLDLCK